jgi:uncharacterized protein (TIGR02722 family)
MKNIFIITLLLSLVSCGGFKAKRVDANESDDKAMEITDKWVSGDTERVIEEIMKKLEKHRGLKRYMRKKGDAPAVFVADIKNMTSEAYFPINDLTDELLNLLSEAGDFILIDAEARERVLKEITYQHDGMVDPKTAKQIGKQTGADLLIFGNVFMKPQSRKGKTIKQYSVNVRMTDLETTQEVARTRTKLNKYSEQSSSGW